MRPRFLLFIVLLAIFGIIIVPFLVAIEPENAHPFTEQKSFKLDFDQKTFDYEQRHLNETGQPSSYIYTYYSAENKTFWIEIPKNSTISNSTLTLTGLILVNRTNIGENLQLRDVDIGDVTSNDGNEISLTVQSSSNNIRLYDSKKSLLWQNTSTEDVYDSEIANITMGSYNDVVIGTENGIEVLNQNGVRVLQNNIGIIFSLSVGNLSSDVGNEVVAGGTNLYLLNSSLVLIVNDSSVTTGDVASVYLGDVTSSSQGNEVVIGTKGTQTKIYLLNYTSNFTEIWNYEAEDDVESVFIGNLSTDAGNEVVAVTSGVDDKVYVLNSTGQSLWNYSLEDDGRSVVIGEFADVYSGNEVVIGVGSGSVDKIYILNSTGASILNYTTDNRVRGVILGNVTEDMGNNVNEILATTTNGSIYELNYDAFPTDVTLNAGDGPVDWSYPGKFRTFEVLDDSDNITTAIQSFLNDCTEKVCVVPFLTGSSHRGRLQVSDVNVSYTYDAKTDIHNQTVSPAWAKTQRVKVNESVIEEAVNVSYTEPALNISINYMKINPGATACGFKNEIFQVVDLSGEDYCNVTSKGINITPLSYSYIHLLWDNTMGTGMPIILNESQPYNTSGTDKYLWIKNITIWSNVSGESFTDIVANTSLNDSIVKGNAFLNVTWNNVMYNITPSTQCPTMQNMNNSFTACYDDLNINGKVDFFNWTQPNASAGSSVFYQVGGSRNLAPNMTSPNVEPSSGLWGRYFNFSVTAVENENDGVSVKLWVYTNLTGGWQVKDLKNVTGSGTLSFNITSERKWVGNNLYKFEYYDYNPSNLSEVYHSPRNTSQNSGPMVERHNITMQHIEGNNTNVSREYGETTRTLMVYLNDSTGYANWTNETCSLWVTLNGSQSDGGRYEYVNGSGYCSHSFNPNQSYSVGLQTWSASLNESYYNLTNPQNYTVRIRGHMNVSILQPSAGSSVMRNQSQNFVAYLSDEYGNVVDSSSVNTSEYNCTFHFNGTEIGTSSVNASGYCNVSWTPNCTYQLLKNYDVNATLGGQDSLNYTVLDNETGVVIRLVDYPVVNIIEPQTGSAFYRGKQMGLNATVNDTCDTCGINSYNVTWYANYHYVIVNFSSLSLNRINEFFMLTGQQLEDSGTNLTMWKVNDTKVECGGLEMPLQIVGSGAYLDSNSELAFLFNLSAGQEQTCYVLHNESNSLQNTTISYVRNGAFESGDQSHWNCTACTNSYCNCTVTHEGTETNGNYSLLISADNSQSTASQTLDYPLSSQYLKVRFKAWGEYNVGSYLRIGAGGGTCDITPGTSDIAYGSAAWNVTTCNVSSFVGATAINVSVKDVGSGGTEIDASHAYVDYMCVADSSGNCITLDTGATTGTVAGRENITLALVNSTEGLWNIPIYHPVGPYTIFANLTGDYYVSAENESYVEIFGLSNVSYFNFTPVVEGECIQDESEGNLCFTGVDIKLFCRVIDKNTTLSVYNFTTNFYNDSTYIGSGQTNESGYAEFLWENSTSLNGTHIIKCNISDSPSLYYNVTENYMEFNITFESSVTNGTMNVTPVYDSVENLTKQSNDTVLFDVTVNNTGVGNMFGISVVVYNKTGLEGVKNLCAYLRPGGSCTGNVTLTATRAADLGNNSINMSFIWSNPDPIGPGFENKTVVINVTNTTVLNLVENSVNITIPYGSTSYSSFIVEDFGNTGLGNATFALYGGNSSLIYGWFKLNGTAVNQTFFPVAKLAESLVNLSVSVPDNSSYMGEYWAYLLSEQAGCTGAYDDCNDTLILMINVTQQDWTLVPKNDTTKVAGLTCNNYGKYTLINVTNQREFNLTLNVTKLVKNSTNQEKGSQFFAITINNSGTTIPLPTSPFTILPFSSAYLNITYNVSGANSSDADTYNLSLSIKNNNSATVPQWVNITRTLLVSDFEVAIIAPNQTYPAGPVSVGQSITIYANATLGENHLNENVTWKAWIGEAECPVNWNTSNTTGALYPCDWIVNCTAPEIPRNPVNNTLVLSGNYTTLPIDFNDTEPWAVIYNDTQPPRIWTVEVIPEGQSSATALDNDPNVDYQRENTTHLLIRVNVTDNNETAEAITTVLLNVSRSGTNLVTNAVLVKVGDYWEYNLTNPRTIGDYKVDVYATDSNGNGNNTWTSVTGYFDIYRNMTFYSNFTYPGGSPITVNLGFYKPGTAWMLHENSSSFTNFTVHKRSYDINVEAWNQTIILENADLNYSSAAQFNESNPENITNPFKLDYFPTYTSSQINIMPSKFEDPIMGIVIEPMNLSSQNGADLTANITLNYTDALQAALNGGKSINQQNLEVLVCDSWDYATRSCTGDLDNTNYINVNSSGGIINFQTTLKSAYIVAEGCYANSELIDCSGFEDINIPGGGSSGSEKEEEKKITSFEIETNLDSRSFGDITMYQGETKSYWLYVTNKLNKHITPSISLEGSIKDFMTFSETSFSMESGESKRVTATVYIPEKTPLGTYTGTILVNAEDETDNIPVTINVVKKDEGEIMLEVNIIKKTLEVGEPLKFQVKLRNMGTAKELKPVLTYLIKEGDTDVLVKEEKENVTLEKMLSFTKVISLNETGIDEGEYLLEVWAETDGKAVNYMETFDLVKPFLATTLGVTLLYTLLILSIIIATIFIRKYYVSWKAGKDAKKRYIFPVDMAKIPQKTDKTFWVGTIAGSKIKAWLNPDDLTTHVLVAGATGSGKSVGASVIVEEALDQKIPVIVFDPTAQWTGFVRGCKDNNLLKYYPPFGMDTKNVRPYKGMIFEMSDPKQKIEFKEFMNPGEITVFTLNNLKSDEFDDAVRNIIDSMFRVQWEEATSLKMIVVFDEVHRLLEKYGGKGGYIALEKACREFRKWGIGLIMCSQVLADFKEAVSGNVLTDVQLNTKSLEDISKAKEKYGETYAKRITRQGLGVGMIHNPKYNDGKPYFVQFRPTWHNPHKITNEELEDYRQFALELREIRKKIEEMEKKGKEMFDIKLELRLAEDKLKLGNFRMAKIYIASLKKSLSGGA